LFAYRIVLIAHLFGLAFGMGGASTIDSIFLVASRRGRVTRELVEVVHAAAALVAGAMVLLVVSGTAFFAVGAESTPKFWAKMVIVGIACLNGLAAHRLVFPLIEAGAASGTGRLRLRPWDARLAAASAAVSGVSWSGALVLGAWHGLKVGMVPILVVYAGAVVAAVVGSAIFVAPRVFVFAPARLRLTRVRSLRDIRAAAAFAVAIAIADAALAIAGRLSQRRGPARTGGFEPAAAPADGGYTGWLLADDSWDLARNDGVSLGRRQSHESLRVDERHAWLGSRDWLGHGGEPASGGR
jgi:hypothetical protein